MVWHDTEFIQNHMWVMLGQIIPGVLYNFPQLIQNHLTTHNLPQQTFALMCASRDEIGPGMGIIVSLEADGATVVFARIEFHNFWAAIPSGMGISPPFNGFTDKLPSIPLLSQP